MKKNYDFSKGIKNPYAVRVHKGNALDKSALSNMIEGAFADMAPPTSRAAPHNCEECDEISTFFDGRTRESLDESLLDWFANGPTSLLSPEHREYYLPVIMLHSLKPHRGDMRRGVLMMLIDMPADAIAAFNRSRRAAIVAYLAFLESEQHAGVADGLLRSVLHRWTEA